MLIYKKIFELLILTLVCVLLGTQSSYAFDYVMGDGTYSKPTLTIPSKGQEPSSLSPFNVSIKRVTDAAVDGYIGTTMNSYYTPPIVNSDDTYMLITGISNVAWYLYNVSTFAKIKELTSLRGYNIQPRWDAANPNVFYHFCTGNHHSYCKYDVSTDVDSVVHDFAADFPEYSACWIAGNCYIVPGHDDNKPDINTRYFAFLISQSGTGVVKAFVYDKTTDTVIGKLAANATPNLPLEPDSTQSITTVSPLGNYVILKQSYDNDTGKGGGKYIYDITLTTPQGWLASGGHIDVGLDINGHEVVIGENYDDSWVMWRLDRWESTYLLSGFGYPLCHPTSAGTNTPGWAIMATGDDNGNAWIRRQLMMISLDPNKGVKKINSYTAGWNLSTGGAGIASDHTTPSTPASIWRLSFTHNVGSSYWQQAWATTDINTKYIHFVSQWDNTSKNIDVYQLTLPSEWATDFQSGRSFSLQYSLTTSVSPSGAGIVAGAGSYNSGQTVNVSATPSSGFTFSSWSGDLSGSSNPTTIAMNKNKSIVANFVPSSSIARNTHIITLSFNNGDIPTIASKYDLIITDTAHDSAVTTMKTINPSMKALYYRDVLTYGSTHYVIDTVTRKHVINRAWGWTLMDISNASYRSDLANHIATILTTTYPQFDGVFLDDVFSTITASDYKQEGTEDNPNLPTDLVTNWQTYTVSLLGAVKTAISSKLAIANMNFYRSNYLAEIDGMFDEWFGHPNWDNAATWSFDANWKDSVDTLISTTASNKYFLAQSGVLDGATAAQTNKLVKFCYASFLMGVSSGISYAKHYFCPSMNYGNYYWYSDWEAGPGNPNGGYFQIAGTNLYRRNFEKGIVMVNPSGQGANVQLEKAYCNSAGERVSTISFSDHEGVILSNCVEDNIAPAPPQGLRMLN